MKTANLILTTWLKAFRPYTGDSTLAQHSNVSKKTAAAKQHISKSGNSDAKEFQRKAHIGNFFAGVHCVFDPRLFR